MALPMSFRDELPTKFEKLKYGKFTANDLDYPIHLHLKENDIKVEEAGSEIVKFLHKKHVLVTGATGFLGKMFVEKLLRCCEDIRVYVIIREKKGKHIDERLNEMLDSYAFFKLKKLRPYFRKNVIAISGDVSKPGLGLSEESKELIKIQVQLIYHVAASVRFDEQLKKAVQTNILGTLELINLSKECKHLEALTYVGTAFSNSHLKSIHEQFYEPVIKAEKLIALTNLFSDEILDRISDNLLGGLPNTYTLTKQSAEDLIKDSAIGIPTCICRPSIVLSSYKEPLRGWGDNLFGPIGYILAVSLGIVHVQEGIVQNKADIVPADHVINHCIAASYKTALDKHKDHIPIYNFTSANNPVTWLDLEIKVQPTGEAIGSKHLIMPYFLIYRTNKWLLKIFRVLFHRIPAYVLDFAAICAGKKPQLNKAYDKLDKFGNVLSFFTMNEFQFSNNNTEKLWNSLNEVDQRNFNFDLRNLNWDEYFKVFTLALREYILKEFLDNLEESKAHFNRLKMGFLLFKFFMVVIFMYALLKFASFFFL